jgi:SAM-dependent methyltransferase
MLRQLTETDDVVGYRRAISTMEVTFKNRADDLRQTPETDNRLSISGCPIQSALSAYWDAPIQSALSRIIPLADKRILVVGCGTNPIIETFLSCGAHVVGIDLSPEALRSSACAHPKADFLNADAQRLPLADASFDVTWSVSTLQYMDDISAVVRGCRNVLKSGGQSVFLENLYGNPAARFDRYRRKICKCPEQSTMRIRRHLDTSSNQLFKNYYRVVEFRVWHDWTPFLYPFVDSSLPGTALARSLIRRVARPRFWSAWRSRYGWIAEVFAKC